MADQPSRCCLLFARATVTTGEITDKMRHTFHLNSTNPLQCIVHTVAESWAVVKPAKRDQKVSWMANQLSRSFTTKRTAWSTYICYAVWTKNIRNKTSLLFRDAEALGILKAPQPQLTLEPWSWKNICFIRTICKWWAIAKAGVTFIFQRKVVKKRPGWESPNEIMPRYVLRAQEHPLVYN